jgi:hypothetical protein
MCIALVALNRDEISARVEYLYNKITRVQVYICQTRELYAVVEYILHLTITF